MKYKYNKWNKRELAYFNKGIKKTEETNEISWWCLFGAVVIMEGIFIAKIIGVF